MENRVNRVRDLVAMRNVIVSVADKQGLETFGKKLAALCPHARFYSTGRTYSALREALGTAAAARVASISDYTGQPEMQGGLVKTLDFKLYQGILSESFNDAHAADLRRTGAIEFDLVVCNLYPFEQAVAERSASCEDARAHIDIGGVALLRAAAKNFLRVAVLCDHEQYGAFLEELEAHEGALTLATRYRLATEAFRRVARYDAAISSYLDGLDPVDALSVYEAEGGRA